MSLEFFFMIHSDLEQIVINYVRSAKHKIQNTEYRRHSIVEISMEVKPQKTKNE